MTASINRRKFLGAATAGAGTFGASRAFASDAIQWKMVTSWPKNSPGVGMTAQRLADRINAMSAGRLTIKLYAAGELVSPLQVLDAVSNNTADMGHTASFFWQGKMPAAAYFTAVPFGMTASEHSAWVLHGGGQELWDELYSGFGVKPLMAGNTGTGMGGWFKKELRNLDDIKGLKYRIPGLGGEILKRLGGTPVSIPPGEIFSSLKSGVVDGAEFLGPWSDLAFGFYKVAPYYYWPGFHEPNGSAECLINSESFAALPEDLKAIVENACAAENAFGLAETTWRNAQALPTLIEKHNVTVRQFPTDVLDAAREESVKVLERFASGSDIEKRIHDSYENARAMAIAFSSVSTQAFLNARKG